MIAHRKRHNILFKTIVAGMVSLFLVNTIFQQTCYGNIFYKNPCRNLDAKNKLAANSPFERESIVDNEEEVAREIVKRILLATLRRARAEAEREGASREALISELRSKAEQWAETYRRQGSPLKPTVVAQLIQEGIEAVLSERTEFLPASERDERAASITGVTTPVDLWLTIREISRRPPLEEREELKITGITYVDANGETITSILSAPTITDIRAVEQLIDWQRNREELERQRDRLKLEQVEIIVRFLEWTPRQLIAELNKGRNIPYCLAALSIKGISMFCATRGDVLVPVGKRLGRDEGEITYEHIRQVSDVVRTHSLQSLIDSEKPVYVIVDVTIEDGKAFAHYLKYERGVAGEVIRQEIPEGLFEKAKTYNDAMAAFNTARADFAGETDKKEKKRKGSVVSEKLGELRRARVASFGSIGGSIFAEELSAGRAEFRFNFLQDYLGSSGTQDNIFHYFNLTWKLKERFENFARIFGDRVYQGQLQTLAAEIDELVAAERRSFEELERRIEKAGSRILFEELEIYRSRLAKLEDLAWVIKYDILGNVEKVRTLASGFGINPERLSDYTLEELRSVNSVLGSIDQRLETRGRDSLGVLASFTFENMEDYENFKRSLGDDLVREFERRKEIENLGNFSIVERFTYTEDGKVDPEKPVTVTFVYKTAQLIGRLGDNPQAIRASMFEDMIIRLLLDSALLKRSGVKLAHTRWASAGIVSEENCHPVDNVGVYTESVSGNQVESVWEISPDKMYPAYGSMGRVFVVLNGDIENYNREALAELTVFPDLTAEYTRELDEGRRISPDITTDTKLIPLRIEHFLAQGKDLQEAIRFACRDFAGSFAIQVYSDLEPNKVFLALGGSGQGLYIGLSDAGYHPSSELYGFIEETQRYIQVPSGEVIVIDRDTSPVPENIRRVSFEGERRAFAESDIQTTPLTSRDIFLDRKRYGHYLDKEISEGADMWKTTIMGRVDVRRTQEGEIPFINLEEEELPHEVLRRLREGEIKRVIITGMGTAETAGYTVQTILQGYLSQIASQGGPSIAVEADAATEFSARIPDTAKLRDTLVIGISQSGGTTDTNTFLAKAAKCGATLLGIINKRDSDGAHIIRGAGGGVLYTGTGRELEIAVASTKAYYAQIAAGALYAMRFAQVLAEGCGVNLNAELVRDIREIVSMPEKMEIFLSSVRENPDHPIYRIARNWPLRRANWKILGCGTNLPGAKEVRIKLSEECYITMPTDVLENFKHIDFSAEPWVLILLANAVGENNFIIENAPAEVDKILAHNIPVTIIVTTGDHRFDGKRARVIDKFGGITEAPLEVIEIPETSEKFASVLSALAGHKLAYETARAMDEERSGLVGEVIAAISQEREKLEAGIREELAQKQPVSAEDLDNEIAKRLLENREFLSTVVTNLERLKNEIRRGFLNNEFTPEDTDLMNDYYYLFRLALLFHDNQIPFTSIMRQFGLDDRSESEVLTGLARSLDYWKSKLMRTIDSVRHQAKFVTVGTRQPAISLSEAEEILDVCTGENLEYYEKTAVLEAYDSLTKTGEAQVVSLAYLHKKTKTGRDLGDVGVTSIIVVTRDRPNIEEQIGRILGERNINIIEENRFTYRKGESSEPIFIVRLLVDRAYGEEGLTGTVGAIDIAITGEERLRETAQYFANITSDEGPLRRAHENARSAIVREGNEVLIQQECIDELNEETRNIIMEAKRRAEETGRPSDIKILPLDQLKALARQRTGSDRRIVLMRDTDLDAHTRKFARCKVLALQNYNFLHLAAVMELGRAILANHEDSIKVFYALLMHRPIEEITDDEVRKLTKERIIPILLPPIDENLIENIDKVREEHAKFIGAA